MSYSDKKILPCQILLKWGNQYTISLLNGLKLCYPFNKWVVSELRGFDQFLKGHVLVEQNFSIHVSWADPNSTQPDPLTPYSNHCCIPSISNTSSINGLATLFAQLYCSILFGQWIYSGGPEHSGPPLSRPRLFCFLFSKPA